MEHWYEVSPQAACEQYQRACTCTMSVQCCPRVWPETAAPKPAVVVVELGLQYQWCITNAGDVSRCINYRQEPEARLSRSLPHRACDHSHNFNLSQPTFPVDYSEIPLAILPSFLPRLAVNQLGT